LYHLHLKDRDVRGCSLQLQMKVPRLFALDATKGAVSLFLICSTIINDPNRKPAPRIGQHGETFDRLATRPQVEFTQAVSCQVFTSDPGRVRCQRTLGPLELPRLLSALALKNPDITTRARVNHRVDQAELCTAAASTPVLWLFSGGSFCRVSQVSQPFR